MDDNTNESSGSTKINPYNPNNKLITRAEVETILKRGNINKKILNLEIYQQSFVHKSYCKRKTFTNSNGEPVELVERPPEVLDLQLKSNERLEFYGDSVVGQSVSGYLFERYPDQDEGFMTTLKTKLVSKMSLAKFAIYIGLTPFLIISRHVEEKCGGRLESPDNSRLEDAFEAFICAIVLDFNQYKIKDDFFKCLSKGPGFQVAETFIRNIIEKCIDFTELILHDYNYKDILLRYYQQNYKTTPVYTELGVEGQPHVRTFTMGVFDQTGKIIVGKGSAKSKKQAEQLASKQALIKYKMVDPDDMDIELSENI